MNMSKLRRALERGNKVVLFDKVRDPPAAGEQDFVRVVLSFWEVRGPPEILEVPTEAEPTGPVSGGGQGGHRSGPGPVAGGGRSPS